MAVGAMGCCPCRCCEPRSRLVSAVSRSKIPSGRSTTLSRLPFRFRFSSAVRSSNNSAGSAGRLLACRCRYLSAARSSNSPAGRLLRWLPLLFRYRYTSFVSPLNRSAGNVLSSLPSRFSDSNSVSGANTSAGNVLSLLSFRNNLFSPVNPEKSPAASPVMFLLFKCNVPVMAASWPLVTSAQLLTPPIASTIASRTAPVRAHTSETGSIVPFAGQASLVTVALWPLLSSKLTDTLIVMPSSASVRV